MERGATTCIAGTTRKEKDPRTVQGSVGDMNGSSVRKATALGASTSDVGAGKKARRREA